MQHLPWWPGACGKYLSSLNSDSEGVCATRLGAIAETPNNHKSVYIIWNNERKKQINKLELTGKTTVDNHPQSPHVQTLHDSRCWKLRDINCIQASVCALDSLATNLQIISDPPTQDRKYKQKLFTSEVFFIHYVYVVCAHRLLDFVTSVSLLMQ